MSHYIESIAYVGEKPWHGIGFEMPKGATPEQMLKTAKLNWTVSKRKIKLADGPNSELTRHFALVRDSDDSILSVVGSRYVPTQNKEVFQFFKRFCDAGKMHMETAGALMEGRYVWALAKFSTGFKLSKRDEVAGYLLLSSPYDLNRSMVIQFTPVRVVCWNTLNYALGSNLEGKGDFVVRLPHTRSFDKHVQDIAEESLTLAASQMQMFKEASQLLVGTPAVYEKVVEYWTNLFKLEDQVEKAKAKGKEKDPRILMFLKNAYDHGAGANLLTAKGTWWGALNAVTYVVDHKRGYKPDTFLFSAWFSQGAAVKRNALKQAIECANKS